MALEQGDINILSQAFENALRRSGVSGVNNSNNTPDALYGRISSNQNTIGKDDYNFSQLFKNFEDRMYELMESISKVSETIKEEDKWIKAAEKSFENFTNELEAQKNSISSDTSLTDNERKEALERLDLINAEKNLQKVNFDLLQSEQKYRKQDIELRTMELKFRADYIDRLKKHEKEEAILKDARGRVGMLGGKMGAFGEYLGNYLLQKPTMNVALEAFAKAGGGGKGIANAIGAGGLHGIGTGLQNVSNFMSKDKVSITDVGKQVSDITSNFGPWGKAIGAAAQGIAMMVEEYDKLNVAAQGYVRNVGGGERSMQKMKIQASAVASEISKWGGMAYKMQDILKNMAELSEKTGRNFEYMSKSQYKSLEDLTKFGIDKDVLSQYDTFGLSVDVIDKKIASIYSTAGKHGLNAKAVTNAVTKNLKMAQNYTFASGVKALERMAERSVALKFNMDQAARFADKVSTLEGAVQAGAGLSVLGGDFARFGNPLQMLYEGLNDAEGLMDRMVNMYSSMAKFDEKKGQIDITSFNRARMKQAAQEMGVDPSEMMSMAMNLARENMVTSQLGKGLDKDTETYIKNIARIDEEGKAVVTFNAGKENEETKAVSSLTMEDKARLKNESQQKGLKEGATVGDILVSTRTMTDKLNDILDVLKSRIVNMMAKLVGGTDEERAQNMGLNSANAELFEELRDDYKYGGVGKSSKKILAQLGMSKEDIEKADKKELGNTAEFEQKIIALLNTAQANGWTKAEDTHYLKQNARWINNSGKEINSYDDRLFSHGGSVVGPGGPKDDLIHARLSNGEYVVNAAAAAKNRGTLDAINAQGYANGGVVKPIKNQLNSLIVNTEGSTNRSFSSPNEKISIDPININMNGTLTLSLNGQTTNIDSKVLIDSLKPVVIDYINEQLRNRKDFRIDRNKTHDKFGIGIG